PSLEALPMGKNEGSANMEIVPPRRTPSISVGSISIPLTRKLRVGISLTGIVILCGPLGWFLSQFTQVRGIVDIGYSRLMLAGLWATLSLMFFIIAGQLWKKRISIPASLFLALVIVLWLDWWAPKPKTNISQL